MAHCIFDLRRPETLLDARKITQITGVARSGDAARRSACATKSGSYQFHDSMRSESQCNFTGLCFEGLLSPARFAHVSESRSPNSRMPVTTSRRCIRLQCIAMPHYRIYRMKDSPRQQFRWAPHLSGCASLKPKDYEPRGEVEARHEYDAWQTAPRSRGNRWPWATCWKPKTASCASANMSGSNRRSGCCPSRSSRRTSEPVMESAESTVS